MTTAVKNQTAIFGGGCFWCTEAIFDSLKGVVSVAPGYSGGTIPNPSYDQVSSGSTGHVEVIRIEFDPSLISYNDLLTVFFNTHDPTSLNRQGADVGPQYRSVVFYLNEEQRLAALNLIGELEKSRAYDKPVVTAVEPFRAFYPAEDYHKRYYEAHKDEPYCALVIEPKMRKLQERFRELLKS